METTDNLTLNPATGEIFPGQALALHEPPTATLSAARDAARALQDVIAKKKNPLLFKGEQYLEYRRLAVRRQLLRRDREGRER